MIRRAFMRMVAVLIGGVALSQRVLTNTPRELVLRGKVSRESLAQWLSVCFTRNNQESYGFAPLTMVMVQWAARPIDHDVYELQCHLKPYRPIRVFDASGLECEYHVHGTADWPSLQGFSEVGSAA